MDVKRLIREYWDGRGESYDRSPGHVMLPDVWRDVLRDILKDVRSVLDVGCGTGFLPLIMADMGKEVVGLDISRGMLDVAMDKARKKGLRVNFKLGDAENLPFKDGSFDAVICRHLIWTLPNPEKAIGEFVRVARKKVVIIDGRWSDNSIKSRLRRFLGRIFMGIYERRNPFKNFHYRKEINENLPFYGGVSSYEIVKIVERMGLSARVYDLRWIREKMLESLPVVYRIAWSGRDYYMVGCLRSRTSQSLKEGQIVQPKR